jgi:hypothetical protein
MNDINGTTTTSTTALRASRILALANAFGLETARWADDLRLDSGIPARSFPGVIAGSGLKRTNRTVKSMIPDSRGRTVFKYRRTRAFNANVKSAKKTLGMA